MPRILDNISESLRATLIETLTESTGLDACVGYFNLRGWKELCDAVEDLPRSEARPPVRLLIGMQGQPHSELRQQFRIGARNVPMDNNTAARQAKVAATELREQLTWGIPTGDDERTLRTLRDQLASGRVRIKLHLSYPLHAKLYLCHRDGAVSPRCGFVGSSNLTFAGMQGQGELNIDVLDHDATTKLHHWFEDRWNDQFSLDITNDLIKILDESWAAERFLSPYLVHLRIAYELSRDARKGLLEFGLPTSMQKKLLDFQESAVQITARNLMKRGGAMIGDVVGLGKTIVATAVALLLQEDQGFETLIVCPKNLVAMWEGYVETYRLIAKVESLSMVHKNLEDLRRYRLVVVDESHNLRHSTRRDYGVLRDYIAENDSKVLLLTATPFNTSMADVASQLGLFIDDDQDLEVRPEAAIALKGETEFLASCDDKPTSLKAFRLSEEPEDWQKLLSNFLIRRTRRFIDDNYALLDQDSGRNYLVFGDKTWHFLPQRIVKPLRFEAAANDPASEMASEEVIKAINSLQLPRYDLSRYRADDEQKLTPDEKEVFDRLDKAGGNLLGFTRTMFMKRLGSSGAVFILSLQRHQLRNYIYVRAIQQGLELPVGAVSEAQMFDGESSDVLSIKVDEDSDLDEAMRLPQEWAKLAIDALGKLLQSNPKGVSWLRSNLFNDALLKALEEDIAVIERLLDQFGTWNERTDSKLDALEKLLTGPHRNEKVLIFSEYADTAQYVAAGLKRRGVTRMEAVTGASDNPTRFARRFSPVSNKDLPGQKVAPADELRVLVSTDVLSEGQNLQDGAIVVNWDLPWAIIKLFQRAGRVDRIGQRSKHVTIYTFLPPDGVEAILALRSRVADRLADNASVFGSDERFLNTPGEEQVIRGMFDKDYQGPDLLEAEQVDPVSAAYEIWRQAEKNHPALAQAVKDLPAMTYATQFAAGKEVGALVYTLSTQDVDRIGFTPRDGPSRRLSPLEALTLSACDPYTPGQVHLEDHHELVRAAVEGPLAATAIGAEGALTGVRGRVYRKLRDHIDGSGGQLFTPGDEVDHAVSALFRSPLKESAQQKLGRFLKGSTPADLLDRVVALHKDEGLTVDNFLEEDEINIVCSMGFAPETEISD